MNLYFDTGLGSFVTGPGTRSPVTTLSFKRGDTVSIAVRFVSGIVVQELATGATGKIGLKESGEYDADFVASDTGWTKTGTGTSTVYTFELNLATTALNALLAHDSTEGNDVASVDLMLEMEFTVGSVVTSSNTIIATVHNDVVKGTESGPTFTAEGVPPVNTATAAAVTINPTGADNSVTYTADVAGADGNDITITYATPAAQATTTVAVVNDAITVTPGTKARMIVTGTLTSDGSTPVDISDPLPRFSTYYGKPSYYISGYGSVAWEIDHWIIADNTTGAEWHSTEDVLTPDLVTTWVPQGTATGTPIVTAAISSAEQVIAAVNASTPAAAMVTATASGTVTGAVAAVAATSLTGGVSITAGHRGAMKVDADFLYVVASVSGDTPTWKKIALSSL